MHFSYDQTAYFGTVEAGQTEGAVGVGSRSDAECPLMSLSS